MVCVEGAGVVGDPCGGRGKRVDLVVEMGHAAVCGVRKEVERVMGVRQVCGVRCKGRCVCVNPPVMRVARLRRVTERNQM